MDRIAAVGSKNKFKTVQSSNTDYEMVVFCHLRWDFVYQRPQHIISRLSKNMKILMIEEPVPFDDYEKNTANLIVINDNLHILQPKTTSIDKIENILKQFIPNKNIPKGWFYSASFVSLLEYFSFETIIYDCMDELTLFKGAPSELLVQEKFLIANADIIFTGGKSLYDSKKELHDNIHCFPSSVDQEHFAKGIDGLTIADDIANIPSPIAGYFGVIDERVNLELINETALANPNVSFVMIGPLAKISEQDLPRQENIYYLGMKAYDVLPLYLKAFDIAIMPFALNDSTKFISPTKTLEYIAAGKPIISTPIKDVVRDYSHCVAIINTTQEFTSAINDVLKGQHYIDKDNAYREILEKTSWNNTVEKMNAIISKTVQS